MQIYHYVDRYDWRKDQRQNSEGELHCGWLDSNWCPLCCNLSLMAHAREVLINQECNCIICYSTLLDELDLCSVSFSEYISPTYSLYKLDGHSHENASHVGSTQVPFLMCTLEIPQKIPAQVLALNLLLSLLLSLSLKL